MNNKGMSTIEAAVIIPISLSIIMLLIWTGLLFYNRNVMDHAASQAAVIGGQHSEKSNAEICNIVMERYREFTKDKTVFMDNTDISVSVKSNSIQVIVSGQMGIPGSILIGGIYKKSGWNIYIKKESPRLRSSVFVRTVSRVKNGLDNHVNSDESSQDYSGNSDAKEVL